MKIEIPLRGHKMTRLRHMFIKLIFEAACSPEPDYEAIIGFIKEHLGLYISLSDARQLALYAFLFGNTDIYSVPTTQDFYHVIKHCPISVPSFVNFKKWSKDVKRLENKPLSAEVTKVSGVACVIVIFSA
jgi:hypothetical protein